MVRLVIDAGWLPTRENVNALPEPLRKYIHDMETNVDPAGMVRENVILRNLVRGLLNVIRWEESKGEV